MNFHCPAWPPDWPEIKAAANALMDAGDWGRYRSEHQDRVKSAISEHFRVPHVRLVCSGTAAVEAALRAVGVGSGDEVILAAFDYPGNYRTVELVGARPVLIDLDENSLSLDPYQLDEAASDQVRAVIVSHLCGRAADIAEIKRQCDQRNWVLIEDACQVPGMIINGSPAGSFGHLSTLSFGGSKPLTAGNGGAILTQESRFIAKINSLLDRPSDAQPLSTMQSAVLLPQFGRLKNCREQRARAVGYLEESTIAQLKSWQWLSEQEDHVQPAYYKIAWAATSAEHRARVIARAAEFGLPLGEAFRSMARSSPRRCRKPVPLDRAQRIGDTAFVLDHAALLLDDDRHQELGKLLIELEAETRGGSRS
jgi:dTDP-4-amino-4,6-dideoxygalactose transaminase